MSGRTPSPTCARLACFVAQDDRPAAVDDVDFTALSAYHRTLLAHDGLTTGVIETWWLEPTTVTLLSQREAPSDEPLLRWLEAPCGTTVQRRRVRIEGARTGTQFLFADSLLVTTRLPDPCADLLRRAGIGAALVAGHVETRRELLWYGRRHGAVASRGYRIFAGGVPVALIQEDFLR